MRASPGRGACGTWVREGGHILCKHCCGPPHASRGIQEATLLSRLVSFALTTSLLSLPNTLAHAFISPQVAHDGTGSPPRARTFPPCRTPWRPSHSPAGPAAWRVGPWNKSRAEGGHWPGHRPEDWWTQGGHDTVTRRSRVLYRSFFFNADATGNPSSGTRYSNSVQYRTVQYR